MRFGESWPAGRGRRRWVSFGPGGCAVVFLLVVFALALVVDGIAALAGHG